MHLIGGKARPDLGHIEAAIPGQPGQQNVIEGKRRCGPPSADILHGNPLELLRK
jgi:hypothetical protein